MPTLEELTDLLIQRALTKADAIDPTVKNLGAPNEVLPAMIILYATHCHETGAALAFTKSVAEAFIDFVYDALDAQEKEESMLQGVRIGTKGRN